MSNLKKIGVILSVIILSIILFACGEAEPNYKVVFIVDGEVFDMAELDADGELVMPDNPSKDGHYFEGWYWDKDVWGMPFDEDIHDSFKTKEMKVFARWSKEKYYVYFDGSGGDLVMGSEEQLVEYGTSAIAPVYEKTGYSYTWDKSFNNVTKDMTVTAIWETSVYNVVFNSNGGVLVSGKANQQIEHGSPAIAPVFVREGYSYGWDRTFDQITSDIYVNAVWTINNYLVTFNLNGGVLLDGETQQAVPYGHSATPPLVEKTGYSLSWDTEFESIKEDTVITAVWTLNSQ